MGLGTAAVRDVGDAASNVAVLQGDASFTAGHLAPSGTVGQVMTRTATGKEWADLGALDFDLTEIGTYQFPGGVASGQDDQLFDTGFTGPANTSQVYHLMVGDNNGRIATELILGSELAGLNTVAGVVWVDDTTVGISELSGNSRAFSIGTNRAIYIGMTTGGNLAIGSTHDGIRPYVRLSEVDGGGGGGANDYVDSATFSLSGANLSLSLGRTGSLSNVSSNSITLPSGGGVIVPTSVVHQGSNDFAITTGLGFGTIPAGTQILFQPPVTNTGSIRVNVDNVGFHAVNLANSPGVIESVPSGLLRLGDVYILIWDHNNVEFGIHPLTFGLSAWYSTGTAANEIPVLGTDGELASGRLAQGGTDGQVLQRTSTGQVWADSGGTITSVATGAGLSGGGTSGAVTIRLDLNGLPNIGSNLNEFDRLIILDQSDGNAAKDLGLVDFIPNVTSGMRLDLLNLEGAIVSNDNLVFSDTSFGGFPRRVTWGGAVARIADQDSLVTANAIMRINDEGVSEVHLNVSNAPGTSQVLSWDGAAMTWADQTGGGGGTGGNYYPIPDANVGGTGNAITITTGASLTSYTQGLMFFFKSTSLNVAGGVTINVDGIGTRNLRMGDGVGGALDLALGEITSDDPVFAVYGEQFDEFYFIPGHMGGAAQRNVGLVLGDVVELETGDMFPSLVRWRPAALPTRYSRAREQAKNGPTLLPVQAQAI